MPHLVKVGDDLIQQSQALHPHVVAVQLDVEVVEVRDGGEQDADLCVRLIVQILNGEQGRTPYKRITHLTCFLFLVLCLFIYLLVSLPACLFISEAHHVPGVRHEEVLSHVGRQEVEENPPVVQLDLLHAVSLLFSLTHTNTQEGSCETVPCLHHTGSVENCSSVVGSKMDLGTLHN